MDDLVITASGLADIQHAVLGGATERCVVLLCSAADRSDGRRLLMRELVTPTDDDYLRRGPYEAELRPAFVALVAKKAARTNSTLVFVHSHPGRARPDFSPIDDAGETVLARFFTGRTPDLRHIALVASEGGVCCRYLGSETYLRVIALGECRRILSDPIQKATPPEIYDRQVRAFGKDGQNILQDVKVGIVGVGGTGSIAAQQLVHLGVRNFMLFDHDRVEVTNLNRLVGSTPDDVGVAKTAVAKRSILAVRPDAHVLEVRENVVWVDTALKLRDVDAIFCCTDSHGSRAVVQQLAYQYLIPCFDVGNVIAARDGQVSHIAGRVQLLSPGLACLTCGGLLDGNEVRRDMMSEGERKQDPYLVGAREPAPSVISLNGTVMSLAVTMFLSAFVGIPVSGRHLVYDGLRSRLRSVRGEPTPNCFICSPSGALAKGDRASLLGRRDHHGHS